MATNIFDPREIISDDKELESALNIIRNTDQVYNPKFLLGKSNKMKEVKIVIEQVAGTDITIMLNGESGTGKELVARSIYQKSVRKDKPFVKVLCAAIPDGLLESELFGHEKGAFTSAYAKKPGKFEFAHNGTIFLDEIGEIPFSLQAKLLQVLQDKEFSRIGGGDVKVEVRIIVATNKNLEEEVAKGNFREDLYYRLNVVSILLPPLRDRLEDIPVLVSLFMERYKKQFNKFDVVISNEMLRKFQEYSWPGNIRELENVIKRIVVLGEDKIKLTPSLFHISHQTTAPADNRQHNYYVNRQIPQVQEHNPPFQNIVSAPHFREDVPSLDTLHPSYPVFHEPILSQFSENEAQETEETVIPGTNGKRFPSLKEVSKNATIKAEREAIKMALSETGWNRKEAAKLLQVSYKALLYKMKECGLEKE